MDTTSALAKNYTATSGGTENDFACAANGTTVRRGNDSHGDACESQRRMASGGCSSNWTFHKGVADRKAKRKKAKEHAVFRSLTTKTNSNGPEVGSKAAQPCNSDSIPELESEKKIRNRASVQRCRERKSHYYNRLETTRLALRRENKLLQTALEDISGILEAHGITVIDGK
jgi:hypothetical protein